MAGYGASAQMNSSTSRYSPFTETARLSALGTWRMTQGIYRFNSELEKAVWVDWRKPRKLSADAGRIYFGHETCQDALPSPSETADLVARFRDLNLGFTLVTPFVTEQGMAKVSDLVRCLSSEMDRFEIVCNDWGLLRKLAGEKCCRPVSNSLRNVEGLAVTTTERSGSDKAQAVKYRHFC